MLKRKISYAFVLAIAFGLLAFSLPANAHPFDSSSGDGTSSTSPYLISTCEQLQLIDSEDGIYLGSHFKLANDIDCATTTTWNEDSESPETYFGFKPIGSSTAPFTGSFDGDNYHINNFYINRPIEDNVALFAYASSSDGIIVPEFKNIYFGNSETETGRVDITGNNYVATLIAGFGSAPDGSDTINIENVHVYGNLEANGDYAGGLAGFFVGSVYNSSFNGSILANGYYIGGLIGINPNIDYHHEIVNSVVNADIESSESSFSVGGLAGDFRGSVASSTYTGNISGGLAIGGLIGSNTSNSFEYSISNSYVEANILASDTSGDVGGLGGIYFGSVASSSFVGDIYSNGDNVGGLIGRNPRNIYYYTITNSTVLAKIESNGKYTGGLVGDFRGSVDYSSFEGDIIGAGYVGGLIGFSIEDSFEYLISNSYVEANIISSSTETGYVGGLGGFYHGSVASSSFIGDINVKGAEDDAYVGGLIGFNPNSDSIINNSFVEANIVSEGYDNGISILGGYVGGLGGFYFGSVASSSFIGNIESYGSDDGDGYVGGLLGQSGNDSIISDSYAVANIISTNDSVGGIYGDGGGDILSSFFSGNIKGRDMVGGLNGSGWGGAASSSFSTGNIEGRDILGGISGQQINTNNCYSDMNITITGSEGIAAGISANLNGTTISNSYFSGSLIDASSEQNNNLYGISDSTTGTMPNNSFWLNTSGATIGAPNNYDEFISSSTEDGLKTLSTFSSDWDITNIDSHNDETWYINEGYDFPRLFWEDKEYYVEYIADENGSISGDSVQFVIVGESSELVTAVPDDGYSFVSWNDGNTSPLRQDLNVDSNIVVTANFEKIPESNNSSNSNSSNSIVPKVCLSVEYGDWQEVLPGFGVQFREVISSSPSGCYLTEEQREGMERLIQEENIDEELENEEGSDDSSSDVDVVGVMNRERNKVLNVNRVLSNRMAGRILLQVEENGEAWYVNPQSTNKYFMGRPADAFQLMRNFGLGISEANYNNFSTNGVPAKYAGQILLRVEKNGEAYYVNPDTLEMHYLGRPADAFRIMRELALGISNDNLRQIQVGE